jgi:hypothetical protein
LQGVCAVVLKADDLKTSYAILNVDDLDDSFANVLPRYKKTQKKLKLLRCASDNWITSNDSELN